MSGQSYTADNDYLSSDPLQETLNPFSIYSTVVGLLAFSLEQNSIGLDEDFFTSDGNGTRRRFRCNEMVKVRSPS